MSDAETIDNTWSHSEISSGPEILSDAEMGDDERPSESRRASQESTEVETQACGNLRT
jgi:hypothetical protein